MNDAAAAGNRLPDTLRVPYVAFIVTRSSNIQPGDLRSTRFERRPESRSDQSLGAGDQYPAQMRALRREGRESSVHSILLIYRDRYPAQMRTLRRASSQQNLHDRRVKLLEFSIYPPFHDLSDIIPGQVAQSIHCGSTQRPKFG